MTAKRFIVIACVTAAFLIPITNPVSGLEELSLSPDAAEIAVWERFSAFDPESDVSVNHDPLTDFLASTVLDVGRSKDRLGPEKKDTYRESRIKYGSGKPSRYEGNRVLFHAFSADHGSFLKAYKEGFEYLSERRPLSEMNKNEQLAFWLNLHNVIVLNKLADEYPLKSLKRFRLGSSHQQAFWDEKIIVIEGVPLSLRDIELIVFKNWDDVRVLYGFYQGSVGGPSLSTSAFTADTVWDILEEKAVEFVNSNRGFRPKGTKADVSLFYKWGAEAYGNSEANLLNHIRKYADPEFFGDISAVKTLRFKYYDWDIADLLGGTLHSGRPNQLGGIQTAGGTTNGPASDDESQRDTFDISAFQGFVWSYERTGGRMTALPVQAIDFLVNIQVHNDIPSRTPVVTIIDCQYEDCEEPATEQDIPEQPPQSNQPFLAAGIK